MDKKELARCKKDFSYFCRFVKIETPFPISKKNDYVLKQHIHRMILDVDAHKHTLVSKPRQGGFSTGMLVYLLWKCLFNENYSALWVATSARNAEEHAETFKTLCESFKSVCSVATFKISSTSDRADFKFFNGSHLQFTGQQSLRGKSFDHVIFDEEAFHNKADEHRKEVYPIRSKITTISSIPTHLFRNGNPNTFMATAAMAKKKENKFFVSEHTGKDCHPTKTLNELKKRLNNPTAYKYEIEADLTAALKPAMENEAIYNHLAGKEQKDVDMWPLIKELNS